MIKVTGDKLAIARLKRMKESVLAKVGDAIELAQVIVTNDAKANHPGKGTPAMGGAGRARDAATGTPRYADQTARLTQSIKPGQVKKTLTGVDGSVRAGGPSMEAAGYAPYLESPQDVEFGTSKRVAYPFFRPALIRRKAEIHKLLAKFTGKGLR